jgi:hypothetical protein
MSTNFNDRTLLQKLSSQGVLTASLPRWQSYRQKRSKTAASQPLEGCLLSDIVHVVGPIASYAPFLPEVSVNGIKYSIVTRHAGNANVGYILTDQSKVTYHVGVIHKILEVKCGRQEPSKTVFQIERYRPTFNTLWTFVRDIVLSHGALGIHLVSAGTEAKMDIVLLEQIIGHVAVNKFYIEGKAINMTIQLSTVSVHYSVDFH